MRLFWCVWDVEMLNGVSDDLILLKLYLFCVCFLKLIDWVCGVLVGVCCGCDMRIE